MKSIRSKSLYVFGLLALTMLAQDAEALTNIPNGATVTAPPQADDAMNFQAPAPGGTFIIQSGVTFTGAITTTNPGVPTGTLVLNSGSTLNGAVTNTTNPLLQLTLNGNATINGAITSQNFSLGQNTLTSVGALNLPSGVVLNTRVVSNALFGHIADTGADSIAGASVQVNVDASGVIALSPGVPLFIISAQGTTSGVPVNVTSNNVLYSFIGNNLNGNITITPTINPAAPIPGPLAAVLADLLAIAAANPTSDIAGVFRLLAPLNATQLADALNQFLPVVDGSTPQASFYASQRFQDIWSRQMNYGRCIYATNCGNYCAQDDQRKGKQRINKQTGKPLTDKEKAECELKEDHRCFSAANCGNVENRYELWGDGFAYFGSRDSHHGINGYSLDIYGGMLGVQVPVMQVLSVGLGGGFAQSYVQRRHVQGRKSAIQTYDATAFLSYDPTHWFVDAAFSFDYNRYKDWRRIAFPGLDRTARARYGGQEYNGLATAGYRFYTNPCVVITPFASLQYSYLHVNRFHEHGAGDLSLRVKAQHYNFLESGLGVKTLYPVQLSSGTLAPEVHGIWLHDYFQDRMKLTSTFSGVAAAAPAVRTSGQSIVRDRGVVGAGISFISCVRLAVEGVYNYEFGKRWQAHEALLKITQRF